MNQEQVPFSVLEGRKVRCILTLGQSNSANHGSSRSRAAGEVYAYHDGKLWAASDPLPGSSGSGGSVWTRLGPLILADSSEDEAVVFCAIGKGSTSVRSWMPGHENFSRVEKAIEGCQVMGIEIDEVIWHQGESDAWPGDMSAKDYEVALGSVIGGIRRLGVECPIYICQATRDYEGILNSAIREGQSAVWSEEDGVFAGVDTDSLGDRFRSDGVHFNREGLHRFAELLKLAIEEPNALRARRHEDVLFHDS